MLRAYEPIREHQSPLSMVELNALPRLIPASLAVAAEVQATAHERSRSLPAANRCRTRSDSTNWRASGGMLAQHSHANWRPDSIDDDGSKRTGRAAMYGPIYLQEFGNAWAHVIPPLATQNSSRRAKSEARDVLFG